MVLYDHYNKCVLILFMNNFELQFPLGQILFSLSWKRRVSIFECNEEAVVDIREYTEEKTFKRSTKGVALSVTQWTKLLEEMPNIDCLVQRLAI